MYEDRLLGKVVLQAVECDSGSWMRSIGRCIGWQDMSGGVVRKLSEAEVECTLLNVSSVRDFYWYSRSNSE